MGDVTHIYAKDENGNPVLKAEYAYDVWGKVSILFNDEDNIANINPFRYRGYYYDAETGLYYLQSRYYDPETGRFINLDIISILDEAKEFVNGLNLFSYCNNNPIMYTDESGQSWWKKFWNSTAGKVIGTIIVVVAVTAAVVLVTIATAGIGTAVAGALGGGVAATIIGGAVGGAVTGAVTGAIIGTGISMVSQGVSNGYGNIDYGAVGSAALTGAISGAIGGAVFGAASVGLARGLQAVGNSGKLTRKGISLSKSVKILSPNKASNAGTSYAGGTLIKFGKATRLDVEVGKLLHLHIGGFGKAFAKKHIFLSWIPGLIGGIIGGF